MTPLFQKLNLKERKTIVVWNAPESFSPELQVLTGIQIQTKVTKTSKIEFALAFVQTHAELDTAAKLILPNVVGDGLVWFCYPKKSSKKYTCELDRDSGWTPLGEAGYEGVRMVAIDADWSALRFRKTEYIETMRRNEKLAISKEGKQRTKK